MKKSKRAVEDGLKHLSKAERDEALQAIETIEHDATKGLVKLEDYTGSDLNLQGWKLTAVLDDILMCHFVDINEDGTMIMRGGLWVPIHATQQAWRVAKVLLAGPSCKVKVGQHVIFPSTFGLKANNINNLKHIVFLNEARIFGTADPE